ncbi:glucose-1-phosphate thymidylyltransferase RfbA [Prochlorococcus marinus]|uniref:glucose-1-phosphate thymidylyltransferase RfbA n=1 Tax=Prochlorococcus marinus TaxID=1219 RepID=UPI001ADC73BD|nr:glucose-1-phosphate thymidylyltransferase RfbA [Prochlorococcus marinus]MBO8217678.1 glucose-1-phosphate thymidylyltransferase RfbA [Prochlorococcus marinus XMU1405]MBW3040841.1 glucose-1-phosphate thymidylyltransferase [Prochlorococcus marinus str. MU1405]MBW3048300.1 glucose-1-phosphate thymidylyltransferase [Prochlorococcus marinus str. MU1406]
MQRKGIILAGGSGTRLAPITKAISKQLMPIYNKPMIYYPLSTLMLCGIREILVITTPFHKESFMNLLGNGEDLGIRLNYKTQENPDGISQAFIIGENFINNSPVALILGDNLFNGSDLVKKLKIINKKYSKNTIFAFPVNDPERYGVVEFDENSKVINIEEKPKKAKSRYAITGLYFYDKSVVEKAHKIVPSSRGELEITSLNKLYLAENNLNVEIMNRGMAWLDTGTFDSLNQASNYIRILEKRQGLKIGCPYEVAWRNNWISDEKFKESAVKFEKSGYGNYFLDLINEKI